MSFENPGRRAYRLRFAKPTKPMDRIDPPPADRRSRARGAPAPPPSDRHRYDVEWAEFIARQTSLRRRGGPPAPEPEILPRVWNSPRF